MIANEESKSRGPVLNLVRLACLICILIMFWISFAVYKAPAKDLLTLFAFFIFYIQLPGLLIVNCLGFEKEYTATKLATGLFAGWAFTILIYFITDLLSNNILLLLAGPALSIVYLYREYKHKKGSALGGGLRPNDISICLCIFITIVLFYCLVNTQYVYMSPSAGDFTYLNPDKAYHMGLINSLSHDYPLMSPWISGVTINYHIFSEMMLSVPIRLFGVEVDAATQSFGPYLTTYSFAVSCYAFFKEMCAKKERAGLYSLLVILSNIYVTRRASTSIAFKFILVNDNFSGYGVAATFVTIIVFKKWYEAFIAGDKNRHKLLLLLTAILMLTTGIKGPMGAVSIAAIWGTILLGTLLRKVPPKALLTLIPITIGFLLVYTFVLGSKGQANASGDSVIAFAKIVDIAFWKKPLVAALKAAGIPKIIRLGIMLLVFMMFFTTAFFVPFCLGYLRELWLVLRGKKEYEPYRVLVYAETMVGLVAMFLLNYGGHSQIYFGLVSAFMVPVIALWFIEDMEIASAESRAAKHALRFAGATMAIVVLCTTASLVPYFSRHIDDAVSNSDPKKNASKYLSISNEEYNAMEWIEDNTEEDAFLSTDRYFSVDPQKYTYQNRWDNRFFMYEVYSNRFSYISGSGYNMRSYDWPNRKKMIETNQKLYDASNEERGDLARSLDIDYVVVSKRFSGDLDLENKDYKLCYTNKDVDVYKIAE